MDQASGLRHHYLTLSINNLALLAADLLDHACGLADGGLALLDCVFEVLEHALDVVLEFRNHLLSLALGISFT